MRKMTKTAVTLAAMSAMTVASASLAFADTKQEANISSIAKAEEAVNTEASGEWGGNNATGWTFTKTDGTKLKNQWAQIDGAWYYFDGDKAVLDGFREIDNKGYFFDEVGRLSIGWRKINSETDAYSDLAAAIDAVEKNTNEATNIDNIYEYGYRDYVWVYSDGSGVAKSNEWFQDTTGLWYYFDENVMVRNVFDYKVNPDNYDAANSSSTRYYGFDKNGAMLVGWNYKEGSTTWNDPTADAKGRTWYFYKSNGQMQQAGWMKDGSNWYLFANKDADGGKDGKGGYPLIVNSFVRSAPDANRVDDISGYEYFYVNGDGELVSGVTEIEDFYKVTFYSNAKSTNVGYDVVKDENKYIVNFSGAGYAAKEGVEGKRFYLIDPDEKKAVYTDRNALDGVDAIEKLSTYIYKANMTIPMNNMNNRIAGAASTQNARITVSDIGESYSTDELMLSVLSGEKGAWGLKKADKWNDATSTIPVLTRNQTATNGTQTKYDQILYDISRLDTASKRLMEDYNKVKAVFEDKNVVIPPIDNKKLTESITTAVSGYESYVSASVSSAILAEINKIRDNGYTVSILDANEIYAVSGSSATLTGNAAMLLGATGVPGDLSVIERQLWNQYIAYRDSYYAYKGIISSEKYDDLTQKMNETKKRAQKITTLRREAEQEIAMKLSGTDMDAYRAYMDQLGAKQLLEDAAESRRELEEELLAYNGVVSETKSGFEVRGSYITNGAVVYDNGDMYVADKDGDLLMGKALLFSENENIIHDKSTYKNAYIIFGNDGKAMKGYKEKEKTVVLGGVSYWSTNEKVYNELGVEVATVFVSSRAK